MSYFGIAGRVSSDNSSSTPLGVSGVFTGTSEDVLDVAVVIITVYADVASATDGLSIQFSSDGTNWDHTDEYTVPAAKGKTYSFQTSGQYMRVVYTNGTTGQAEFRLQTLLKRTYIKPSSHRIQDPIIDDDDAELMKSIITGVRDDGIYDNVSLTNTANLKVSVAEYGDTPSIDAFDRLRISEPYTIFDSKQLHDKQPLFWDEALGGSATSVHSSANAATQMTVTANSADYVIRQTKQRFNYQPGKSQLIFFTFHAPQSTGLTKRMGLFSGTGTNNLTPNNGIFFESDGTLSWNICKNGTTAETVTQANWNVDKLDGTGVSGITLDTDATQIGIIDFEWLGVGRVRVGFVIDGIIRYVHKFNHANDPTFTSVYMSSPNLPIRYSIETDGTAGDTLDHICSSVISEGGIEETGLLTSVNNGTTKVDANSVGTVYAVKGVRLKAAYMDITVTPVSMSMLSITNDNFLWELRLNPTVAGTFTYSDVTNSAIQEASGATANTVTGGTITNSGYVSTAGRSVTSDLQTALRIGSAIDGTTDTLVLCVTPLSSNADILGSLTVRELL